MTSRTSKLVVAAVLASSIPAAALARDCDHEEHAAPHAVYVPTAAPPPVYAPAPAYAPAPVYSAPVAARQWREGAWRERRIHELRTELRDLDAQRAEVYARYARNPGRLHRFDRWYTVRRAELERRLNELAYVAWR
jgi:hypothetical protein